MQELLRKPFKRLFHFLVFLGLLAGLVYFLFQEDFTPSTEVKYGVTFSQKYAEDLKLDWRQTYLAILNDLQVDHLRLIAYWDEIGKVQDEYFFGDLDWQLEQAERRGVEVIMTVGRRVPRWPECHDPTWIKPLAPLAVQQQQLQFIKAVVNHYKGSAAIQAWQVENEPLFGWFGECPKPSKKFLKEEVALVKSLDSRPIIITDSGELNHWQGAGSLADTLGITMYRIVWNERLGFWNYSYIPASIYRHKADLTKIFHKNLNEVIITELQMEPWTMNRRMVELTLEEQQLSFDLQRFRDNIIYAKRAGFTEVYAWGVEYWYWLNQQGHTDIWEEAKTLWR